MTLPRAVVLALNAWTQEVRRAADDYYTTPTACCPRAGCDQLATGRLCDQHERDTSEARTRRRKANAA